MKILSAQQIQQWDAFTIQNEPVDSIDLMERAAQKCTDWLIARELHIHPVKIFCGKGNNGGDGLAIARQLITAGSDPFVYILEFGAKGTNDFQINLARLHGLTTNIFFIQGEEFFPVVDENDVVVDALFGSGLNRPLAELNAALVEHINAQAKRVISIDVPSGMFLDKSSVGNPVIKANHTLTFQSLKLCLLMAENEQYFGRVHVFNIGLHKAFLSSVETAFQLTTLRHIKKIYKPRKSFSHKGTYGHALIYAGNKGKMGAAFMCAKACLRAGAGLVTCCIPANEFNIIQTAIPEAMVSGREEDIEFDKYTTIGIGPGLGTSDNTAKQLQSILTTYKKPMVLDADALNVLSKNNTWLDFIGKSVLTPHPKEFDRLFGKCENDFERLYKAIDLSKKYPFIIVLKGHYTLIAYQGKGHFNSTGNAGLAKGGSGDTLTGIITALLSQGYSSLHAAILGVYIHGLSADLALKKQTFETLMPSDVTEGLAKAFRMIAQK